jgi:hypothetical protein
MKIECENCSLKRIQTHENTLFCEEMQNHDVLSNTKNDGS